MNSGAVIAVRDLGRRAARVVCALAAAALVGYGGAACTGPARPQPNATTATAVPDKPSKPQVLHVVDVAGDLQLTQPILDDFQKQHPDIVSRIVTSTASVPDLTRAVKAEQSTGRPDVDLVLTGLDGLAAGAGQGLWLPLLTEDRAKLPDLDRVYTPESARMQRLAQNQGVVIAETPAGPLIEYNPAAVPTPPTTADALLAWAKANPGRFEYAVPRNSAPGRALLMGLPYVLGDSDPGDPANGWAKTWAYLAELAKYQPAFPSDTTQTMKDLANGTAYMVAGTTGWYLNPIALGQVPPTVAFGTLSGFHFVADAHYVTVPKGVDRDRLSAALNLIRFALQPGEQARTYDEGYFYPGPAVAGVTTAMAPQPSRDIVRRYGGPALDALIAGTPQNESLPAGTQLTAFALWDRKIATAGK